MNYYVSKIIFGNGDYMYIDGVYTSSELAIQRTKDFYNDNNLTEWVNETEIEIVKLGDTPLISLVEEYDDLDRSILGLYDSVEKAVQDFIKIVPLNQAEKEFVKKDKAYRYYLIPQKVNGGYQEVSNYI